MIDLVEIGKNIALLRKAQGLSQEQAALDSGLSLSRFQDIEHKGCNTTIDTLRYISQTFGVSPLTLGLLSKSDSEILSMLHHFPRSFVNIQSSLPIGSNIYLLRRARGLTQKQLAAISQISTARLRDIEHGCANVTITLLARIAKSLNISLFALAMLTMPDNEILDLVRKAKITAGMEAT